MDSSTIEGTSAPGVRRGRSDGGRRRLGAGLGAGGWVLLLLAPVLAAGTGDGTDVAAVAADVEAGRRLLDEVSAAKKRAYDLEGDARERALLEVARAYAQVADDTGLTDADRAEAAFRAGEIFRSRRHTDEAWERFEQATRFGVDESDVRTTEFAARGLLELAHLRRRQEDLKGALRLYAEVRERFPGQDRSGAHSTTWSGKLLIREGRLDEARELYVGFATSFPDYPLEAIRNMDLLAVSLAEAGREEAAHEAVALLESQMEPVLAAGGVTAERVQHSLASLRVTVLLSGY